MTLHNHYSKWDHIGDSDEERENEDLAHRTDVYRSLMQVNQQLIDFAAAGAIDEVKDVLKKGAHVNVKLPQNGNTPLHMALWLQHGDVARLLIQHGADVESKDNDGVRPLHTAAWAAFEGDATMTRFLLEKGCDINAATAAGNTPLHHAATASKECVEILLGAGANPLLKNAKGQTPLGYSREKKFGASMKRKTWMELLVLLEEAEAKWESKMSANEVD
eukprot:Rhum_TRINITY_DN21237_c0_g1::Rhum_TRINITY_DN21237_c0_g1_i1::g.173436::m.173436